MPDPEPRWRLETGDCREILKQLAAESVDAVVCDPPYDLLSVSRKGSTRTSEKAAGPYARHDPPPSKGFMGLAWDGTGVAFQVSTWAEVERVLKPGGHLLAFGGTRTYHRLACAIEDAGFEIRDTIHWVYASGFPKSMDLAGALDKRAGVKERPVLGEKRGGGSATEPSTGRHSGQRGPLERRIGS